MLPDSLFISGDVHERDVVLADGAKHVMYFREVSEAVFRRYSQDYRSANEATRDLAVARIISQSLTDPDGKVALTVERAALLKPKVSDAILQEIIDINGMKAEQKAGKK